MQIDASEIRAAATGTPHDSLVEFTELSDQEIVYFTALIKVLRKDIPLLTQAGDPALLSYYGLIHNFLALQSGKITPAFEKMVTQKLAEWPHFVDIFLKDEVFRKQFDRAYKTNRLTALRGFASGSESIGLLAKVRNNLCKKIRIFFGEDKL